MARRVAAAAPVGVRMAAHRVVVVGGGIAGCAAAEEAARLGLPVTLIDEHPQGRQAMSFDAPYFYGARLDAVPADARANGPPRGQAGERLASCRDHGVEVLTGTCCWGNFVPGPNTTNLANATLGVADATRSWLIDYDHLILAPGGRDLVLSFPGWQRPGVLGANGADALLGRYGALAGRRMVILGSGNVALRTARLALDHGVAVATLIEVSPAVRGDAPDAAALAKAGVPILLTHTVERVIGDDAVHAIRVVAVDGEGRPAASSAHEIACDTVCMAFGVVPNVELAAVAGCRVVFDGARGGWVPELDTDSRSIIPSIFVVGDGAGTSEAARRDPAIAAAQGRRAARAIARDRGRMSGAAEPVPVPVDREPVLSYARTWLNALGMAGGLDVMVCPCENVTRRQVLDAVRTGGHPSQDLLKRRTRVGAGVCQGKRCRDQTLLLLAEAHGVDPAAMSPGSYRAPVRPIPLSVMAALEETEAARQAWPIWLHPVEDGAPGYASAPPGEDDRA